MTATRARQARQWVLENIMEIRGSPMKRAEIIRRIAAETMPGSDKEKIAIKLAAFVLGMHADCLQRLVDEERKAIEHDEIADWVSNMADGDNGELA